METIGENSAPTPAPLAPIHAPRPIQWLSILQLVFSLIAALSLLGMAVLTAGMGFNGLFNQKNLSSLGTPSIIYAVSMALCGLLLLPSALFSLLRLLERPVPAFLYHPLLSWRVIILVLVLVIFPASLAVGNIAAQNPLMSWLVLPIMHGLATGIPILFFVTIGLRGLSAGSPQRIWGIYGAGVALGPLLIIIVEIGMLIAGSILVIIYVASQPSLSNELAQLAIRLRNSPPTEEQILQIMQPYLTSPVVVISVFAFLGVLVPLTEEILKPIGMVFLLGRSLTPAQGFTAGILSGAGYALSESLFRAATGTQWLAIVVPRAGTDAIHILATGLVGLGLAYAWGQGRYLRLGLLLVAAIGIHGLWNALSLFSSAPALLPSGQLGDSRLLQFLGNAAPYGLVLETFVCITLIGWINYFLRKRGELNGVNPAIDTNLPPPG